MRGKRSNIWARPIFLSVILPAFKQPRTISRDIKKLQKTIQSLKYRYEIVVVVDGIVDKTFDNAKKLASKNVHIVGYQNNRGKGYAVRYGMVRTRGNLVAFIDAGFDLNPQGISMLIEHMKWYDADIIVGSKRHPVSKVDYPLVRRILSVGYQIIIRIFFHIKIRDTQTGLKVFRRSVVDDVVPRLLVKRFAFDIEILSVARSLGYKRIYEAPIELNYNFRQTSIVNKKILITILHMFWDTMAVFYRLHIRHYYDDKNAKHWVIDPEITMTLKFAKA